MNIYAFAFKKRRSGRLHWNRVSARSEAHAISLMRSVMGESVEPYAGPLVEKCAIRDCQTPATVVINQWLAVCAHHNRERFHMSQVDKLQFGHVK